MSGSDSPVSASGGSGGSAGEPCQGLRLERNLVGPVPGVADALRVGDRLDLALHDGPPVVVVVVDEQQRQAGAIIPTGRLLECLQQGVQFLAVVKNVRGGAIWLEVQAAK